MEKQLFRCSYCKEKKCRQEFSLDRSKSSGVQRICKICIILFQREWRKRNPKKYYEKSKNYIKKYPKKQKARMTLAGAIRRGEIIRLPCVICKNSKSHGHHPDYEKPLEVIWLCSVHHMKVHHQNQ